ncbi:uncharacterized protein LOC134459559 [Engraulis encrasicolus]|uniref:uncharacterized protein LOC134459559 n=1 Tax=Engraulis encrasicolus TaxID=184585 RepID=UPI002FCF0E86
MVPEGQQTKTEGSVWYLPHHGVYHPRKGNLRVVFDCGASFCGKALNAELLKGPDLTNSLVSVLNRFRQEPVGLMADITAMFHQVKVAESDVDFLRFLWWPEGDVTQQPVEFRMTVHLFGATSSPSCASYALRKTATDNQEHFSPEELCKMNLGWDEEVPPHIREQWSKWSAGFPLMSNFKVQRCFKTAGFGSVTQAQLHHFADASDQGYGTATYLRLQNDQNNIHVALVMGKGRVAPLKRMTIPRMELAAAVLATKSRSN